MKRSWIICAVLVVFAGWVNCIWALRLEGEPLAAKIVAVEEQNGKQVEVTLDATSIDSVGFIQGQVKGAAGGASDYKFADIKSIVNDEANHLYIVTLKDGSQVKLESARLVTSYTSTTFNCMVKDASGEKEVRLDANTFRSVEFALPQTGAAPQK